MTALRVAAVSHPGLVRGEHQDRVVVDGWMSAVPGARVSLDVEVTTATVVAVVDGMGGHRGGALAAATAAPLLAAGLPAAREAGAAQKILESVADAVAETGARAGAPDMGATAAVVVVGPDDVQVVNVGDCRVYRAAAGMLTQLTSDDRAERAGRIVVTQYLGGPPKVLDPHHVEVEHGSRRVTYLLCSDGLTDVVDKDTLRAVLNAGGEPADTVEALLERVLSGGAPDNVSIVVARVDP
ncbi:PP2C family protein-serine/threonine phosphatase [Xylanimonas protaetiae]|uniref:PPM-type phosphatase domain-containing protein n=1 Tax=Xylanimonas protaetiae TaxID=2509457 RepID=A0A4P6FCZ8_9MICO|nr:protein phosphatase 2C domain-containing protein [Xylanimonas protaetiae]QAY71437.1 hypothetical protein ET471_16530 [Xylanimonas protaetiae]